MKELEVWVESQEQHTGALHAADQLHFDSPILQISSIGGSSDNESPFSICQFAQRLAQGKAVLYRDGAAF